MNKELKELIEELTTTTTLTEKWIIKLYKEELEECGSEIEAAKRVRKRVELYMI